MPQIRLSVSGMNSRAGLRAVTARLRDVPGVQTVLADRAAGVVVVSGPVTAAEVVAVFDGTDHQALVLTDGGRFTSS